MFVSLLLPVAAPAIAPLAVDRIPLEPRRVSGATYREVASAQVPLGPFEPLEGGSAAHAIPRGDVSVPVRLGPTVAEDGTSRASLWVDADRDGVEGESERIDFEWRDGPSSLTFVSLEDAGLSMSLMLYGDGEELSATALTHYHHVVDLDVDGASWRLVFLDHDLDGAVSGGDQWVGLDQRQQEFVRLTSLNFECFPMDELCYVELERALRLDLEGELAAVLERPELTRPEFLARRAARVNARVFADFDRTRAEFLEARGIELDRPVDPEPPTWYHARDLEEALAHAREQGRPLWVEFMSDGCQWCKRYDWLNHRDAAVTAELRRFTLVKISRDMDPGRTADALELHGVPGQALFGLDGEAHFTAFGWMAPEAHVERLREAWASLPEKGEG